MGKKSDGIDEKSETLEDLMNTLEMAQIVQNNELMYNILAKIAVLVEKFGEIIIRQAFEHGLFVQLAEILYSLPDPLLIQTAAKLLCLIFSQNAEFCRAFMHSANYERVLEIVDSPFDAYMNQNSFLEVQLYSMPSNRIPMEKNHERMIRVYLIQILEMYHGSEEGDDDILSKCIEWLDRIDDSVVRSEIIQLMDTFVRVNGEKDIENDILKASFERFMRFVDDETKTSVSALFAVSNFLNHMPDICLQYNLAPLVEICLRNLKIDDNALLVYSITIIWIFIIDKTYDMQQYTLNCLDLTSLVSLLNNQNEEVVALISKFVHDICVVHTDMIQTMDQHNIFDSLFNLMNIVSFSNKMLICQVLVSISCMINTTMLEKWIISFHLLENILEMISALPETSLTYTAHLLFRCLDIAENSPEAMQQIKETLIQTIEALLYIHSDSADLSSLIQALKEKSSIFRK